MEFVDRGDVISMRIEEYDHERLIDMTGNAAGDQEAALLGRSIGYWEGDALVVETTNISWGHFNTVGIPLTAQALVTERFVPRDGGLRLDYELSVSDPTVFTETVNLSKYWIALDNVEIQPFECTN